MANNGDQDVQAASVAEAVTEMKLEPDVDPERLHPTRTHSSSSLSPRNGDVKQENGAQHDETKLSPSPNKLSPRSPRLKGSPSSSRSPSLRPRSARSSQSRSQSRSVAQRSPNASPQKIKADNGESGQNDDDVDMMEEKIPPSISLKLEPGEPPKLRRSHSTKVTSNRPPPLFDHLPDKTEEAKKTFDVLPDCTYASKYLGYTEHAMDCDCSEEWDSVAGENKACGEDSDCINRATKMECYGDCACGSNCQNQRFQRHQYADVSVFQTEKKGYGLRANVDLHPHEFVYEYIGEVINEGLFRRRMIQYDQEGIKHFYFMSLSKGEFVDATRKGNLGRFCNHSCNPNCYVDKWVVGDKLRMGIFADRHIRAGEELVFNYNVDRYGADPQPCYCGEPNCTGYIGGKTQTERATKLSYATIEALGIDDLDAWDTAVAKKPRKKKMGEDDEEYVDSVQPRSLDEAGVTKVMAQLVQCKEKWIVVKLLARVQRCEDERAVNRVVRMHGYQILNSQLTQWKDDNNVVIQILDILEHFPRLTRNKIIDSKIESTIEPLTKCGDERVETKSTALLYAWSQLPIAYRIPRVKRDPNAAATSNTQTPVSNPFERRERTETDRDRKSRSRSPPDRPLSKEPPSGPRNPTKGPRSAFHHGGPRPFRRQFNNHQKLPPGWFAAEAHGKTYYYSDRGETTWTRPTMPAHRSAPQQPPPPKTESKTKALQNIIDTIINAKETTPKTAKSTTPATPVDVAPVQQPEKKEKWRQLPEEKQKKIYENTLFPHIKHVVDKFKHKLPKEELKRLAKELSKKLVNSDYKNSRVDDPTRVSDKQAQKIKHYAKEYFDKAVVKHRAYEKKRAERKKSQQGEDGKAEDKHMDITKDADGDVIVKEVTEDDELERAVMEEDEKTLGSTSLESEVSRKRKRVGHDVDAYDGAVDDGETQIRANGGTSTEGSTPNKRARSRSGSPGTPPTPPPPPPGISPDETDADADADVAMGGYEGADDANDAASKLAPPPPPPPAEGSPFEQAEDVKMEGDDVPVVKGRAN